MTHLCGIPKHPKHWDGHCGTKNCCCGGHNSNNPKSNLNNNGTYRKYLYRIEKLSKNKQTSL